jgi:hypothetical protein
LIPLRGDLHVRDVRYEIIKGTDFDGHNIPSDDQMVRDKDRSSKRKRAPFEFSPACSRSQGFSGRLSCSGTQRFLYRQAFEKFSQCGFSSHFRGLGREEAVHPHFHPIGVFR